MKFDKESLAPYIMFSRPIQFNKEITLYPVIMENVMEFQNYSRAITFRKDSRFSDRKILKMTYMDFLYYTVSHPELNTMFDDTPDLSNFYIYTLYLLKMVCRDQKISFYENTGTFVINDYEIDSDEFDNIRRIIILQNGINFDIDEFLNYDTERSLKKAEKRLNKNIDPITTEDYIDALCVSLHLSEKEIQEMTIRKFYRLVKLQKYHEEYTFAKSGEMSGMVTFKEPIKYWIRNLENEDAYAHLKTDENELKNKISE